MTAPATPELDELAHDTGRRWADSVIRELRSQGRAVIGMWPGTLSEARGRSVRALSTTGGTPVDRSDREQLARALYDTARNRWLECRDGEP